MTATQEDAETAPTDADLLEHWRMLLGEPSLADGSFDTLVSSLFAQSRTAPWNARQWLEARQTLVENGQLKDLPALQRLVRQSTTNALKSRTYDTECVGQAVDLSRLLAPTSSVRWLGRRSVSVPQLSIGSQHGALEPPVIVVDQSPLDVVTRLAELGEQRPIVFVAELSDFDAAGELSESAKRGTTMQQDLTLRTDFHRFAGAAATALRSGSSTVRDHLRAYKDPYVFTCPALTIFRGSREAGYPFLRDPVTASAVAFAMPSCRPDVAVSRDSDATTGGRTEWYVKESDQIALLERLSLVGLTALSCVDRPGAILVLSAPGCSDRGLHPRDAVANSLKHWRTRFACLFHTVFIACGPDTELANNLDVAVNRQVYASLVRDDAVFAEWHWDPLHLALHVNREDLGAVARLYRATGPRESSAGEPAGNILLNGRRSKGGGAVFDDFGEAIEELSNRQLNSDEAEKKVGRAFAIAQEQKKTKAASKVAAFVGSRNGSRNGSRVPSSAGSLISHSTSETFSCGMFGRSATGSALLGTDLALGHGAFANQSTWPDEQAGDVKHLSIDMADVCAQTATCAKSGAHKATRLAMLERGTRMKRQGRTLVPDVGAPQASVRLVAPKAPPVDTRTEVRRRLSLRPTLGSDNTDQDISNLSEVSHTKGWSSSRDAPEEEDRSTTASEVEQNFRACSKESGGGALPPIRKAAAAPADSGSDVNAEEVKDINERMQQSPEKSLRKKIVAPTPREGEEQVRARLRNLAANFRNASEGFHSRYVDPETRRLSKNSAGRRASSHLSEHNAVEGPLMQFCTAGPTRAERRASLRESGLTLLPGGSEEGLSGASARSRSVEYAGGCGLLQARLSCSGSAPAPESARECPSGWAAPGVDACSPLSPCTPKGGRTPLGVKARGPAGRRAT